MALLQEKRKTPIFYTSFKIANLKNCPKGQWVKHVVISLHNLDLV